MRAFDRIGEPFRESLADLHGAQAMLDHLAREKVSLHECAEVRPTRSFARRHDRRVRDWNSQRMAEKRRHGEPVGDSADHRASIVARRMPEPWIPRFEIARVTTKMMLAATSSIVARRFMLSSAGLPRRFVGQDLHRPRPRAPPAAGSLRQPTSRRGRVTAARPSPSRSR